MPNRFESAVKATAPVATKPFTLPGVRVGSDKDVVIHCRHAGFSTPAVSSAILKASGERRKIAEIKDEHERMMANAHLDITTLGPAIVSWENVIEGGAPLTVTPELVGELLLALVENNIDLFLTWKMWVNLESNFLATPPGDPADLGK